MVDIVIPLGKQSPFKNAELRYCLRGIEKFVSNYRNIIIVGECPTWLTNIIHIPAKDTSFKDKNIMEKVKLACQSEVTDEFLFMNDDHFIIKPVDALNYPYYYSDDLRIWSNSKRMYDPYKEAINNTIQALTKNELPTKHFDIHCPILYNKDLFVNVMERYNWSIKSAYVVKSLYCNTLNIEGQPMVDCKISEPIDTFSISYQLAPRHVFSVGDRGMNDHMFKHLNNIYSKPSRYEK